MNRKKVLLFIDSLESGGAQRQLIGLADLLQRNGYAPCILYYHSTNFHTAFLDANHIDYRLVEGADDKWRRIPLIRAAFKAFAPDVVISYGNTVNIIACIVRLSGLRFRLIASERNTTQRLSRMERVKFWLMRRADAIVPNSQSQKQFICTHFKNLAAKTHVITNFINKDVFVPATNKQAADVCRVVCVARIAEQKNVKLFLQAVKELKQRGEQFVIDWYGLPFRTYGDECNALIREYDIADVFRFHAPTNEIIKVYQSSDLFCLPSIYEGFPNVVCEAMCCGLPVVCSDVNDNGYIVADGTNGFLFNPKDVESMASTLQRFFHLSAEQKEEMARKSREISLAKFSADTFIQQYIKLIEQ